MVTNQTINFIKIFLILTFAAFFTSCDCRKFYVNQNGNSGIKNDSLDLNVYISDIGLKGKHLVVSNRKPYSAHNVIFDEDLEVSVFIAEQELNVISIENGYFKYDLPKSESLHKLKLVFKYVDTVNLSSEHIQSTYELKLHEDCDFSLRLH